MTLLQRGGLQRGGLQMACRWARARSRRWVQSPRVRAHVRVGCSRACAWGVYAALRFNRMPRRAALRARRHVAVVASCECGLGRALRTYPLWRGHSTLASGADSRGFAPQSDRHGLVRPRAVRARGTRHVRGPCASLSRLVSGSLVLSRARVAVVCGHRLAHGEGRERVSSVVACWAGACAAHCIRLDMAGGTLPRAHATNEGVNM